MVIRDYDRMLYGDGHGKQMNSCASVLMKSCPKFMQTVITRRNGCQFRKGFSEESMEKRPHEQVIFNFYE